MHFLSFLNDNLLFVLIYFLSVSYFTIFISCINLYKFSSMESVSPHICACLALCLNLSGFHFV